MTEPEYTIIERGSDTNGPFVIITRAGTYEQWYQGFLASSIHRDIEGVTHHFGWELRNYRHKIRETPHYEVWQTSENQIIIKAKEQDVTPKQRILALSRPSHQLIWSELQTYKDDTFDLACVFELGIGARKK